MNNDLLKTKMEYFDFSNPPTDPIELAKLLSQNMLDKNGIGLAANQLSLPYNVFVVKSNPIICAFNPRIVHTSEEEVVMEEGCLSFPNLRVEVKRPVTIKLRFTMPNGETVTNEYTGLTSRVIQHEIDHLNGILFYERATKFHRDRAFRKMKNANRRKA